MAAASKGCAADRMPEVQEPVLEEATERKGEDTRMNLSQRSLRRAVRFARTEPRAFYIEVLKSRMPLIANSCAHRFGAEIARLP